VHSFSKLIPVTVVILINRFLEWCRPAFTHFPADSSLVMRTVTTTQQRIVRAVQHQGLAFVTESGQIGTALPKTSTPIVLGVLDGLFAVPLVGFLWLPVSGIERSGRAG
jgi:hypothetical protein